MKIRVVPETKLSLAGCPWTPLSPLEILCSRLCSWKQQLPDGTSAPCAPQPPVAPFGVSACQPVSLSACQPVSLSKSSWGLENAPQRSTKSQSYAHQMHGGNHFDGLNIQNPERTLHVRRLQRQVTSHYPWLQKCKITKLGIEAWNCLEQKVPLCCTETTETLSARNGQ